jgi:hypothetical protein
VKEHASATVTPTGPYVFVCYAHDERDIVLEQIAWLRGQGFQIWFDEAIEVGSRWSEDLARAVDGCAVFLYFLSPRSTSSRYCLDEVHFALECGRPIVPVEIAPVALTPGLKLSIGGTHRIFMHRMPAREFRLKLASGLRAAMHGEQAAHPIESRPRPPLQAGAASAMNWRPAVLGISTALLVFIAMMVIGR